MIIELKNSRHFRKMGSAEQNDLYDNLYYLHKKYFLSNYISAEEKSKIEDAATQQIMERGRQELEKSLQ